MNALNIPTVMEFRGDLEDVSGTSYIPQRTENWALVCGHNLAGFGDLGRATVRNILDFSDGYGREGTLRIATQVAIQEPPLLGSNLADFIVGAQVEINNAGLGF